MFKTSRITRIVVAVLIFTTLNAGFVSTAPASAQKVARSGSEIATQISIRSAPIAPGTSPSTNDCFSPVYHAASDCDRLASQAIAQSVGPTIASCFSAAYHAASDCDRLASQAIAQFVGPRIVNCFSEAYHAASDCDRLAFDKNNALAYR